MTFKIVPRILAIFVLIIVSSIKFNASHSVWCHQDENGDELVFFVNMKWKEAILVKIERMMTMITISMKNWTNLHQIQLLLQIQECNSRDSFFLKKKYETPRSEDRVQLHFVFGQREGKKEDEEWIWQRIIHKMSPILFC